MKKLFEVLKPNKLTIGFFLFFLLLTWLANQGAWVFRSPRETGEPVPFMYSTLKSLYGSSYFIVVIITLPVHFLMRLLQSVFSLLALLYWPVLLGYFYVLSSGLSRIGLLIINNIFPFKFAQQGGAVDAATDRPRH